MLSAAPDTGSDICCYIESNTTGRVTPSCKKLFKNVCKPSHQGSDTSFMVMQVGFLNRKQGHMGINKEHHSSAPLPLRCLLSHTARLHVGTAHWSASV